MLVVFGEFGAVVLLGDIEIPEDLALDADGNAEKRPHRRMVRRKSDRARIGGEVGEPDGFGVADQLAEQSAVAVGAAADPPRGIRVRAVRDEVGERAARRVDDAERRVAGADEAGRRLTDPVEGGVQFEAGTDGAHGFEQLRDAGGELGGSALEPALGVGAAVMGGGPVVGVVLRKVLGEVLWFGRLHTPDTS